VKDPIGDVAGGATQQQGETRGSHGVAALVRDQQPGKHGDDRARDVGR